MTQLTDRINAALEGRYAIERQLGAGGMATVYLARDLKHERRVALKVLKPELAAVIGADRFLAEIKPTASPQHPHILPLFDSGTADGQLFYVMPCVDGETLRGKLQRETPSYTLFADTFATDPFHTNYDVAPDGTHFVMLQPVETNQNATVVLNFANEVRARMASARR